MSNSVLTRRAMLGLGAAAAGSGLLASCARGSGGSGQPLEQPKYEVPSEYQGRQSEIVVWHAFGGTNGEAMNALAKKFNDSQDEVYAAFQFQGTYDESATKLTAALQTNTGPDVTLVNQVYQGKLMLNGLLDPLDDYIDIPATYIDQLSQEWAVGDQHYRIPFARSTPVMYFNRDVLAEAGLPDAGPETWDELRDWGAEITKIKDPKGEPLLTFMNGGHNWDWYFQAFAWQFGGQLSDGLDVTVAEDGAMDAAAWFQDFYDSGLATKASDKETFTNGFVAFSTFSSAGLGGVAEVAEFEVGTAFLPKQAEEAVATGGSGWTVLKGVADERHEAIGALLRFLAEPENSAFWATATGYVPVVEEAVNTDIYQQTIEENPYYKVAYDQLQIARQTDPIRTYLPSSTNLIYPALEGMWVSGDDVTETMETLQQELQKAADQVKPDYEKLYGSA